MAHKKIILSGGMIIRHLSLTQQNIMRMLQENIGLFHSHNQQHLSQMLYAPLQKI
jgi:hypothetical protein